MFVFAMIGDKELCHSLVTGAVYDRVGEMDMIMKRPSLQLVGVDYRKLNRSSRTLVMF
jgi:hypothetical protein